MKFNKITVGYVIQTFETAEDGTNICINQEFIANNKEDFEDMEGDPIAVRPCKYQPFNMRLDTE